MTRVLPDEIDRVPKNIYYPEAATGSPQLGRCAPNPVVKHARVVHHVGLIRQNRYISENEAEREVLS